MLTIYTDGSVQQPAVGVAAVVIADDRELVHEIRGLLAEFAAARVAWMRRGSPHNRRADQLARRARQGDVIPDRARRA